MYPYIYIYIYINIYIYTKTTRYTKNINFTLWKLYIYIYIYLYILRFEEAPRQPSSAHVFPQSGHAVFILFWGRKTLEERKCEADRLSG